MGEKEYAVVDRVGIEFSNYVLGVEDCAVESLKPRILLDDIRAERAQLVSQVLAAKAVSLGVRHAGSEVALSLDEQFGTVGIENDRIADCIGS